LEPNVDKSLSKEFTSSQAHEKLLQAVILCFTTTQLRIPIPISSKFD